jgi:hypothetical protein
VYFFQLKNLPIHFQIEVERARSVKWASMINSEAKYFAPKAKEREKMVNRIYKGVPDSVRGRLWYILLEIDQTKREKKGVYEQMKELARRSSPDIRQIDLVHSFEFTSKNRSFCYHQDVSRKELRKNNYCHCRT